MRGETLALSMQTMFVESCFSCGVQFGMTTEFKDQRLQDGGTFYCPAGHGQHYTDSWKKKAEEARREKTRIQAQLDREKAYARDMAAREAAERRSHAHTKGELTKTRKKVKRAEAGVCPHCNRTFQDLASHMNSKHKGAEEARQEAEAHGAH